VYSPWTHAAVEDDLVSTVDVAPTIVDLAGVGPPFPTDGTSFARAIGAGSDRPSDDAAGVFLEWAGDDRIPAWTAVRTADFTLIRYADGFEELYDLGGRLGPADPWESTNRAADPRYAGAVARLRELLGRVMGPG
jgi:arylsulfatase A-like enzyme